jgi:ABC-type bacteriocin/lantibiotic exporter with double-glycine peptidase domain
MLRYRILHKSIQKRCRNTPFQVFSTVAESPAVATSVSDAAKERNFAKLNRDSATKLLQFSKPEWPLIGASAATLVVTSSITLFLPYASGQVIDVTMSAGTETSPMYMAGGLFGLISLSGFGVYLRTLWLSKAGNSIVARLRQQAYQKMLVQDVPYLERLSTGDFCCLVLQQIRN